MKRKPQRKTIMPDFCSRRFPFHYHTALNNLQKIGVDIGRVEILAIGEFENYRGEVRRQKPAPGTELRGDTPITLEVGFYGSFDELPYRFFYGLKGVTRISSEWEQSARKFMAPFDAALIRRLAHAKFLDLKFNFSFLENDQVKKFLEFFGFDLNLVESTEELHQWLDLLPSFSIWGGNGRMTAHVLGLLFGFYFTVIENVPSEHDIPKQYHYRLGADKNRLGRETILGKSFRDLDSAYRVVISGFESDHLVDLLPGGKVRKKIEKVLDWCMPSNLTRDIVLKSPVEKVKLGGEDRRARLGIATFI